MDENERPNSAEQPKADSAFTARIFTLRGERKLVSYIVYHRKSGPRPQSLRIQIGQTKSTSITLKNKDFYLQYQKAINVLADFHSIPASSVIRKEMAATASDFLAVYGLQTRTVTVAHGKRSRIVENVAVEVGPIDPAFYAEQNEQSKGDSPGAVRAQKRHHGTYMVEGRVRGVTYRPRSGEKAAHIHVRPWRAKTASFSLENTSFSAQYARAIAVMVQSLALEAGDPIRIAMEQSGPAFLQYYNLNTQPVSIPDVAVVADAHDQPPT